MYYVYLHINEGGVFYAGCGSKKRPKDLSHRSPEWKRWASGGYSILIINQFENQQEAWDLEKELIAYFRPFCNKSKGGPGSLGLSHLHTPEAKAKIGLASKLRRHTLETREKMSNSHKGKLHNEEFIIKMLGNQFAVRKLTEEQVLAIRNDPRTQLQVANQHQVSRGLISKIKSLKLWSYL